MRKRGTSQKQRGFTLIELLVTIAIIGVLSSVVLASLNSTREKARDARRIADFRQMRTALEFYYDAHGHYPGTSPWLNSVESPGAWIPDLVDEGFISALPNDPVNNASNIPLWDGSYSYAYNTSGTTNPQDYSLITQLEDESNPNRCEIKCWRGHHNSAEAEFCGTSSPQCSGTGDGYSIYIYADH